MQICGEHGFRTDSEIAYASNNCPACDQVAEIDDEHQRVISDFEDKISELHAEISDLQAQVL